MVSYAIDVDEVLVLVDPLLPPDPSSERTELLAELDGRVTAARALEVMITIPYHTRSAEEIYHRYAPAADVRIWGHPAVARRYRRDDTPLEQIRPGKGGVPAILAAGVEAFPIGNPRRYETPLWVPGLRSLVFGDAVVGYAGELKVWQPGPFSDAWYRGKLLPTLRPLLDLEPETVLTTHGPPIVQGGTAALHAALAAPPWDHASA